VPGVALNAPPAGFSNSPFTHSSLSIWGVNSLSWPDVHGIPLPRLRSSFPLSRDSTFSEALLDPVRFIILVIYLTALGLFVCSAASLSLFPTVLRASALAIAMCLFLCVAYPPCPLRLNCLRLFRLRNLLFLLVARQVESLCSPSLLFIFTFRPCLPCFKHFLCGHLTVWPLGYMRYGFLPISTLQVVYVCSLSVC